MIAKKQITWILLNYYTRILHDWKLDLSGQQGHTYDIGMITSPIYFEPLSNSLPDRIALFPDWLRLLWV